MGQKLAFTLNRLINAQATDSTLRADIIDSMASATRISSSTVNEILQGSIDCPPIERLQGFAKVLSGTSVDSLRSAAESDGCSYEDRLLHTAPIREVIPKEQYLRLQKIKADLERALGNESILDS